MHQCKTQQAVLAVFEAEIKEGALGEIVRASQLTELRHWEDAPSESSRQLALRMLALKPSPNLWTVFIPGHIIPESIASPLPWSGALATSSFSSVANLDFFAVDNSHIDLQCLYNFSIENQDYESLSRYVGLTTSGTPEWLISNGLTSARLLSQRPWYSAFSPTRLQWLKFVNKAIERDLLNFKVIQDDISEGLVRPSLVEDFNALISGIDPPHIPDLNSDSLFVLPELRMSKSQYQILQSKDLQERTVKYAKLNNTKNFGKQGWVKYLIRTPRRLFKHTLHLLRRLIRLSFYTSYFLYSISFRPAVRLIRQLRSNRR